jgi:surface antigen
MTRQISRIAIGFAVFAVCCGGEFQPFLPSVAQAEPSTKKDECSSARQKTGQVVGGLLGAVIGNQAAKKTKNDGTRTVATIIGAAGGAWLGGKVSCSLGKEDRARLEQSTTQAARTGKATSWSNSETGVSGGAVVSETRTENTSFEVPVIKERISQVPPLELIGENYKASGKLNVRQSPDGKSEVVDKLNKGDVVSVTGKVQGQPWYMISQDGAGVGFVHVDGLKPAFASTITNMASAETVGTVEQRTVEAERLCRTVKQTVTIQGKATTEDVTACQGPNGWEIA